MSVLRDSRVVDSFEDIPNARNHEQHEGGGREHPGDIAGLGNSSQSVAANKQVGKTRTS